MRGNWSPSVESHIRAFASEPSPTEPSAPIRAETERRRARASSSFGRPRPATQTRGNPGSWASRASSRSVSSSGAKVAGLSRRKSSGTGLSRKLNGAGWVSTLELKPRGLSAKPGNRCPERVASAGLLYFCMVGAKVWLPVACTEYIVGIAAGDEAVPDRKGDPRAAIADGPSGFDRAPLLRAGSLRRRDLRNRQQRSRRSRVLAPALGVRFPTGSESETSPRGRPCHLC